MWCGHDTNDKRERLQDLIDYFEGTCEYCIANMGMESYVDEVLGMIDENGDAQGGADRTADRKQRISGKK